MLNFYGIPWHYKSAMILAIQEFFGRELTGSRVLQN